MQLFALLLFFIGFFGLFVSVLSKMLHLNIREQNSLSLILLKAIFTPFKWFFGKVFGIFYFEGFMSFFDRYSLFTSKNKGFVIDGVNKRLSNKASFQNILVTGAVGLGKSSSYIYSNIFSLAKNKKPCSLIINDPKMDFIYKTSGYLKKCGYEIYSLNPNDLSKSIFYNPLLNCHSDSDSDIEQLARIIVSSTYSGNVREEDRFWINGGIKLIFIVAHCLINTKQDEIINLPNLLHCLNSFGDKGDGIDKFISQYASSKVYNMWKGMLSANENVLLSFLSTAQNALISISVNEKIEKLLTKNTFDFKELREKRVALFINIPPQLEEETAFISNLFYTQMFNYLTPVPTKDKSDVYALLDEAGQFKISKLHTYTTFLRQSRVGFMLLIQDYNQLVEKYGKEKARVIADGGMGTKIYFSNTGNETASHIAKRIGSKRIYQLNGSFSKDDIMPMNKVITMKDNEVLFFHSNKKPTKLKVKKYFETKYKRYTRIKPYIPTNNINFDVDYIDFRSI
jgi:type IV secretory pathway TraG/TraD family ATPase VirD4